MKCILFQLGSGKYGVPLENVIETIRMPEVTSLPKCPQFLEGVINIRGQHIGTVDLKKRLELNKEVHQAELHAVIIRVRGLVLALKVDRVLDIIEISETSVDKSEKILGHFLENIIEGVASLKKERVILLDLEKLLSTEEEKILQSKVA